MPINPIDMLSMAPKTQEVTQYKHAENQKTFNQQVEICAQFANEIKHNSKQTVKTTNNEDTEYRYDAKDKGNNSNSNQSQKKKKENEKDSTNKNYRIKTSNFDIKI